MLGRVGQRLGYRVVRRDLDLFGQPPPGAQIEFDRQRRVAGQRLECRPRPPLDKTAGWMPREISRSSSTTPASRWAVRASCNRRSFRSARRRNLGALTTVPSDRTANDVRPKSIPTSALVSGAGNRAASAAGPVCTTNEAKYRPAASLMAVTLAGAEGRSRDQRTSMSPIFGRRSRPLARILNRALAVNRTACRLSFRVLNRGGPALGPFRLLEDHGGHVREPRSLRGRLHRGQPGRQLPVGDVRQTCLMRLLTDAEAVVEHDPGAAERPGERGALARRRVEAVVVPELHVTSIFGLMARYGDIRAGRHRVFDSVFVTRYRHPVFTAAHPETHGTDHAGRLPRLRVRTGRVQRRGEPCSPAREVPAQGRPVAAGQQPQGGVVPQGCGRSSRTCAGTTGGRTGCDPARTSPDPSAAPRSRSSASTSISRTAPPDTSQGPSAVTTGLKAGGDGQLGSFSPLNGVPASRDRHQALRTGGKDSARAHRFTRLRLPHLYVNPCPLIRSCAGPI